MMIAFWLMILALLLLLVVSLIWAIFKWRGLWRALAAIPAIVFAGFAAWLVTETSRNPTSHNLWPFEVVIWAFGSLVLVGVLALARALFTHSGAP
jgi:predicted membrane protein